MNLAFSNLILNAWIAFTIPLYSRLDGRRATLVVMLGGWAFLPNCEYPVEVLQSGQESGGPTHAIAFPSAPWFNKATAIGIGCLLGSMLFHRATLLRGRPRWFDLPIILWTLMPAISAAANGLSFADGLFRSLYLSIAWGVPYALGRIWFSDADGLRAFAWGWVIAGLIYLPFALAEFVAGPFWYESFYSGHPYRFVGNDRWIGHRPLVFLENGNQFGMWSATAGVAAVGLWKAKDFHRLGWDRIHLPDWPIPVALIGTCILWQSHGAILLMLGALLLLFTIRWVSIPRRTFIAAGAAFAILILGTAALLLANPTAVRDKARAVFHGVGKSSFTWRFARVEEYLPQLARQPLLGWGRTDWSQQKPDGTFVDPIALSFWLHAVGMFGVVGFLSAFCTLVFPIAATILRTPRPLIAPRSQPYFTLAAIVLALNIADLFFNSGLILPILLVAGGLSRTDSSRHNEGQLLRRLCLL